MGHRTAVPRSISTLAAVLLLLGNPNAARCDGFEGNVRPLLQQHCLRCHGGEKPKGGVDLSKFGDEAGIRGDRDLWERVVDAVVERTMPPPGDRAGPNEDDRQRAAASIRAILDVTDGVPDPGPSLIQRLTRRQYNNTIRDLLGVDTRPADAFPADGGGGAGFDNNASTLFVPPILMERYLAAAADVLAKAEPARFVVARPGDDLPAEEAARRCIAAFARRAFRRPVEAAEVERPLRLYRRAAGRGEGFEDAVRLSLRAVLVSPAFLYLLETDRTDGEGPYRVTDHELACRLSYFLWSSMPDGELFDLADAGRLHEPGVLEIQVRRMLSDPKSRSMAEDFAGQWLRVGSLADLAEPDRRLFPEYTPELRDAMVEEAVAYFHAILREDRPVLELFESHYTFLNDRLARHYGIAGVDGPEFRRVELPDRRRGGVLGMAAVLTLTSYPRRTSPVLRGKWVLEELLGTPPPPPPPMIKALPTDDRIRDGLTFRQRLEMHRKRADCASCHSRLDPLGFGLENYDVLGRWRDRIQKQPVDASGKLTTGEEFVGPAALRTILMETRRELLVRNLVARMLAYALRRGVEYYDAPAIKQVMAELEARDYRGGALITAVVESLPFQYRRGETAGGRR
ncbi:DUF1592 domain-containing protein [Aquisphaera insulae]|uniref:DUF1592 domain-containing protein n=1 Tax=Aquisphaera insulae TaxID=2712864 RepID=UPI0013EDD854|nr:DUF1592 domain-containing protein [Aquisphaera insulae]